LRIISEILLGSERERDNAFADGLYVAGERFVLARAEDWSIWACAVSPNKPWLSTFSTTLKTDW
jgi:hypothetical protein